MPDDADWLKLLPLIPGVWVKGQSGGRLEPLWLIPGMANLGLINPISKSEIVKFSLTKFKRISNSNTNILYTCIIYMYMYLAICDSILYLHVHTLYTNAVQFKLALYLSKNQKSCRGWTTLDSLTQNNMVEWIVWVLSTSSGSYRPILLTAVCIV